MAYSDAGAINRPWLEPVWEQTLEVVIRWPLSHRPAARTKCGFGGGAGSWTRVRRSSTHRIYMC